MRIEPYFHPTMSISRQANQIMVAAYCCLLLSGALEVSADPVIYVANTSADLVTVIDATTYSVLDTIAVGVSPTRVAVTSDGTRAFVTNTGSDSVSVIDTATRTVVATVGVAAAPSAVAVTPNGAEVYIVASDGFLQVIDTALIGTGTDPVVTTISFGTPAFLQNAMSVAILPDGTRAYAIVSGSVRVIDTTSHLVLSALSVGIAPNSLAFSPDGGRLYVSNAYGVATFNFLGQLMVIDTATDAVLNEINIWSLPGSVAVTPDGSRAYIALRYRFRNSGYGAGYTPDRYLAVVDLEANAFDGSILLPSQPGEVSINPDGSSVYVAIPGDDSITVIDTAIGMPAAAMAVAPGPSGLAIAVPEPADGLRLALLFGIVAIIKLRGAPCARV